MPRTIARPLSLLASLLVIGFTLADVMPADAVLTLAVDRTDDVLTADACTAAPDDCSLRGAIRTANVTPGADVINLPQEMLFTLTNHGENEEDAATGDLDILDSVTINGNGSTVDGDAADRVFEILRNFVPGTVTITNLTVTNGQSAAGAGVFVQFGTFIADHLTITGNHTVGQDGGGGIAVGSSVNATLTHLTVSSNTTEVQGGGVAFYGFDGSLRLSDSTITENTSGTGGGADLSGNVTIENTDFVTNHAIGPPPQTAGIRDGGGLRFINGSLTIRGGSFSGNDARADGAGGAMYVLGDVRVSGTQITGNNAGRAAGISASAGENMNAVFDHVTISGNHAIVGTGGAMELFGNVTLANSEVIDNSAVQGGAGLAAFFGNVLIDHDLIILNDTEGSGGGILASASSTARIENTTINANTAHDLGGGIFKGDLPLGVSVAGVPAEQQIQVRYTTIDNNGSLQGAANIHALAGAGGVSLLASIVAYSGLQDNCNVALDSLGFNVEFGHSCGLDGPNDREDADPLLSGLTDNGGTTRTQALQIGSPAINLVSAGCPPPSTDQRGYGRPAGSFCDAGAFERGAAPVTFTPTPTPSVSPTPAPTSPGPATFTPTALPMATQSPTRTASTPTRTASDTTTATPTAASPTPPTRTPAPCVGDCNHDGKVSTNELVTAVAIALAQLPRGTCAPLAANAAEPVTIADVVIAVDNAIDGCPP